MEHIRQENILRSAGYQLILDSDRHGRRYDGHRGGTTRNKYRLAVDALSHKYTPCKVRQLDTIETVDECIQTSRYWVVDIDFVAGLRLLSESKCDLTISSIMK